MELRTYLIPREVVASLALILELVQELLVIEIVRMA